MEREDTSQSMYSSIDRNIFEKYVMNKNKKKKMNWKKKERMCTSISIGRTPNMNKVSSQKEYF